MPEDISKILAAESHSADKEKEYWLNQLAGELVKSNFPYDYTRPEISSTQNKNLELRVTGDLLFKLIHLTNHNDSNLYIVLLACLTLLLSKYTGNHDIILAAPIYKQQTEGEFINTALFIRNQLQGRLTVKELLLQVKTTLAEADEHLNYPIEQLMHQLDIPDRQDSFLSETVILLENIHKKEYIEALHSNILFSFKRWDDCLAGVVEYNPLLYKKESLQRIVAHFIFLLKGMVEDITIPIRDLDILTAEERHQLLFDFNDTRKEYGEYAENKTISRWYAEQVEKTPHRIALVSPEACGHVPWDPVFLTHRELNKKSNCLARVLRQQGVSADTIVGIMAEPSPAMLVGILGILKAGGAYLPIDPELPPERLGYMLKDSQAKALLTSEQPLKQLKLPWNGEIINIREKKIYTAEGKGEHTANIKYINHWDNLVYVIYTSGTTGNPKGVLIKNKNLVNYVTWFSGTARLTMEDRAILTSSFNFDLGYTSIFPSLLKGGQLHLVPRETYLYEEDFLDYLEKHEISYLKATPSLFSLIINRRGFTLGKCRSLRLLVLGGEEINMEDLEKAHSIYNHIQVMNHYGPTETTIGSVTRVIDFEQFETYRQNPTIGTPIHNTAVYILDKRLNLLPIGTAGELYISGDGLARGYLNQPELTFEKFLPVSNRFYGSNRSYISEKLYQSGDLARWMPEGFIEFLGRMDYQVKIRGYRIELGEIEKKLHQHPMIKDVVAMDRKDSSGNKYLCAYIVPHASEAPALSVPSHINVPGLRDFLLKKLPDYMIPSYFEELEEIPLTPNGKADRKRLPEPTGKINTGMEYEAPHDEVEQKVLEIWQEVLCLDSMGINDNFFSMGGDSINMIQVSSRLLKTGLKMKISDLFLNPTVKEFACFVSQTDRQIPQAPVEGKTLLTPIQHWFFEKKFTATHHYNQAMMLYREKGFDKPKLENVFTKIMEHHDMLRTVYKWKENKVIQENRGSKGKLIELEIIDLKGEVHNARRIAAEANRVQEGIDMTNGPLVKLTVFKTPRGDHLLITIHHLVIDGVSWRILLQDFAIGWQQAEKGEEIKFQDKTDSYQYWAEKLREYSESKEALKELAYWQILENTPIPPLPKDFEIKNPEKHKLKYRETITVNLNQEETEQLLTKANQAYNTESSDILLTALGMCLYQWAGVEKAAVHLEGHGREPIIEDIDISRTVGWFTSQYPVVLDMNHTADLSYQIKSIKEMLRRIPHKGIGYGILRYLTPNEKKAGITFSLEPEITFNYLGQFAQGNNGHEGIFKISPLPVGNTINPDNIRGYTLDITGMVLEGRLSLSISCNKYQYKNTNIQKLALLFREKLIEIVRHCMQKKEKELTPSDLGDQELSLEELNEISDMINL